MEEMIYAPIIIPTLNRFEHFKACVESLAECSGSKETELYISVDYPPDEKYFEGHTKVVEYVKSGIVGFRNVNIYIQEKNLGAGGNLNFLRNEAFSKYDRVIFTEDDNVFSPCFLEYINKGLEKYKNNNEIFGICGYNYPISMPKSYCDKYNYYFAKEYSAWGVGYLKERFIEANKGMSVEYVKENTNRLWNHLNWNLKRIIIDSINKNKLFGDLNRTLYLIDSNKYCVFPTENMVVNKGHDGSGINCGNSINDRFSLQYQSDEKHFEFIGEPPLCEDKSIRKKLDKYFSVPFKSKIRVLISLISYNLR